MPTHCCGGPAFHPIEAGAGRRQLKKPVMTIGIQPLPKRVRGRGVLGVIGVLVVGCGAMDVALAGTVPTSNYLRMFLALLI